MTTLKWEVTVFTWLLNLQKERKAYVLSQAETIVNVARRQYPYLMVQMQNSDFKDFKQLAKNQYKNMDVDNIPHLAEIANCSTKYFITSKGYTDEGGIK